MNRWTHLTLTGRASRMVLDAGPRNMDLDQLSLRRYSLSGVVDDMEDCADPGGRAVLMATAWREAAELALLSTHCWIGTGKWLLRELRASGDLFGLAAWVDGGAADDRALAEKCRAVLDSTGGYLQDGFIRGEKPGNL